MIAGLEEISRGSLSIDGKKVNDVPPKDRDIAMVLPKLRAVPAHDCLKNMAFGLQLRNYPKAEIENRVHDAAQILGLTKEMLERKPKALSGGQRQRVALGPRHRPQAQGVSFRMNRSPISTRRCACRCAPRSRSSTAG